MVAKQLSIFLENKSGRLTEVTEVSDISTSLEHTFEKGCSQTKP